MGISRDEFEREIKRLEKKLCCIIQRYDTFEDFPAVGKEGVFYFEKATGVFYYWNGVSYSEVNNDTYEFLARQSFEPYQENPPIPLTVDAVQFERYLDAKYLYIEGTQEHRIYFLCIPVSTGLHQYRYAFSLDEGKTWDFNPATPHYFEALGSGDEVGLHEHYIYQVDALNWRMYYQAYDGSGKYRTKLATSTDGGLTWTRQGVVLDVGAPGEWDSNYAGFRNVIKLPDGTFYAAYEGHSGGAMSAGAAKSTDGLTWTKIGQVFEMEPGTYPWEGSAGLINYVQYIDGNFVMMYGTKQLSAATQNTNRYIGLAYSADGINYHKYKNNPIINLSDFLVDTPGSWNYGTEDFISWDIVPNKEGAYTIITRARPVYAGGPMKWNFGLYWFGNRINSDDIINAELNGNILSLIRRLGVNIDINLDSVLTTSINDVWFISTGGDNSTSEIGNIFKPAFDPFYVVQNLANDGDTLKLHNGTYEAGTSVPLVPGNFSLHSLAKVTPTTIIADPSVTFTIDANNDDMFWLASDISSFGTSVGALKFYLLGKPNITALRNGSSVCLPFGFYDALSDVKLELGNVSYLGGGRNWFLQSGADNVDLHIDKYEASGSVCFWQTASVTNNDVYKNINVKILEAIVEGNNDNNNGLIRINDTSNRNGNYNFKIGRFLSNGNIGNVPIFSFDLICQRSIINIDVDELVQVVNVTSVNSYTNPTSGGGCTSLQGLLNNTIVNIHVKNLNTSNTFLHTYLTSVLGLNNSELNITIDKGVFTSSAPFVIRTLNLSNNSKVTIDCKDCYMSGGQSAFWIFGNTIASGSSIVIKGNYQTSGNVALINTRDTIVLEKCTMISSGAAAAVQTDATANVIVKEAYSNSIGVDVNITELVGTIIKDVNVI